MPRWDKRELVNLGPHEFLHSPTQREPNRSKCVWCGVHGDIRADRLSRIDAVCPQHGDERWELTVAGVPVVLLIGRRTRDPAAVIELPTVEFRWSPNPNGVPFTFDFLRGFASGVLCGADPTPTPSAGEAGKVLAFRRPAPGGPGA